MSSLADKVAALRIARPKTPEAEGKLMGQGKAIFLGNADEVNLFPLLKPFFGGISTFYSAQKIELLTHLHILAKKHGITKVVSTQIGLLSKLLELSGNIKSNPSLEDYAGSVFEYAELEIVFIHPLAQLHTVSYARSVTGRYISKIVSPGNWSEPTGFSFAVLNPDNVGKAYDRLATAFAIGTDIETVRDGRAIRCIGFTGVWLDKVPDGAFGKIVARTESYVLPIKDMWAVIWMRKFCALPVRKIFQNGKYDCSYLLRYNSPPANWYWDTAHFMHSWYSELPKDLAFLNAFFLRKVVYWKDLAETSDEYEYYKYNALDTWATVNVWLQQISQAPYWAKHNYFLEFPLVYPCLLAEMTGIKRDMDRLVAARKEQDDKESRDLLSLTKMLNEPRFNPGSPKQVKLLLRALGCSDIESSNEKDLNKAKLRHPINGRIIEKILDLRGTRKLISTYLRLDSDREGNKDNGGKEFEGFILYALNPHGTDTARLASREHHFWCGLQIQNVPRGPEVKQTLQAVEGFFLGECDLEQAESRDTANISGDEALIAAVSGERDFHSVNASAFFGVPYSQIYDDSIGKTKDKKLRDLAKRVNHGANYNMGPGVLIDTMGLDKLWEAKKLLRLLYNEPKAVAEHLLGTFHKTYKQIKGAYYPWVIQSVRDTKMLVSRAYHHTPYNLSKHPDPKKYIESGDWTRYCFGNPEKNKRDLNSYVAHCPQSLNARTLNEAFLRVFYEIALPNPESFRLHAQIHDSILFSYKAGREDHADKVRECMEIPVTIRDVSGNYRNFTVPAALKIGMKDKATGKFKRAVYWSETE